MCEKSEFLVIVSLSVLIALILAFSVILTGDDVDIVDVKGLGQRLCGEHGLEYSHREYHSLNDEYGQSNVVPTIYCKNPDKKIVDRVVRLA